MNETYSNPSSTLSSIVSNSGYSNGAANSSGYNSLNHTNNLCGPKDYLNSIQNGCFYITDSTSIPRTNPWTPRANFPTNSIKSSLKISPTIVKTSLINNQLDVREEKLSLSRPRSATAPLIEPLEQTTNVNEKLLDIKKTYSNNALLDSVIESPNNEVRKNN